MPKEAIPAFCSSALLEELSLLIGYHFDTRMRSVLNGAQTEAQRLRTPYVGPEHFLLALLADATDIPAAVLVSLGAQPEILRTAVEGGVRPSPPHDPIPSVLPYTSRAKRTLELALEEARRTRAPSLGPEFLLLGLLQDDRTRAFDVLSQAGVTLIAARETIRQFARAKGA